MPGSQNNQKLLSESRNKLSVIHLSPGSEKKQAETVPIKNTEIVEVKKLQPLFNNERIIKAKKHDYL